MQDIKNEKIIIVGHSGSGKDFLQRELIKKGLRFQPKLTTRPKRSGETDGVEYFFTTNNEFESLLKDDSVLTYQSFEIGDEIWHYAITKENFENNQIFIMTPFEISQLSETERKKCFIVYLCIDEQIRIERVQRRKDMNDSISRRFLADRKDFEDFSDYDMKVTDHEFDVDVIYDLMS